MIQIFADGSLVYDSRLEGYDLLSLQVTTGVAAGGSAAITMPPGHVAYNSFTSFKTIVEIYRDGDLIFRGRPLYPTDDFLGRRTITCEGERCFLRDAVSRPYDYQGSPEEVFTAILTDYNAQVQEDKRFVIGTVTATDPNDYIWIYSETPEQISDTLGKLLERVGGYIVFTTNGSGDRVINWYAELTYQSDQEIRFGENLLDFSRSSNTELATRIIPYGAKNEETGERLTIESVNDGVDYIEDADAIALRGIITLPVIWDDVTVASNLLHKAQAYLASSKLVVTTLTLSAVDLAMLGEDFDHFRVGDRVHVISEPHGVDSWMLLTDMTVDLLNPSGSTISLGQSVASLTGSDVAGDRQSQSDLQQTERDIRADYSRDVAAAIASATTTLTSLIQQTEQSITTLVSEEYATNDELQSLVSSQITQLADSITVQFTQLQAVVDSNDASSRQQFQTLNSYIRLEGGDIILGEEDSEIVLRLQNDRLSFFCDGAEVAYINDRRLYITDGEFVRSLRLGKFAFVPRENGNLSFLKVVN